MASTWPVRKGDSSETADGKGCAEGRPAAPPGRTGAAWRAAGALTAGRAAVGPLARVPDSVLHQLPLHVEGLPALIAGEHLVGRVCLLMLLQVTEVTKPCGDQTRCSVKDREHFNR